jgi:hypothetical protein
MMRGSIDNISVWASKKVQLNLEDEEERNRHKHFRHTGKGGVCDHCTYFKGIVWRTLSRRDPVNLDGLRSGIAINTYTEGALLAPRSLESVALEEEAIERAQHDAYTKWCASRIISVVDIRVKKPKAAYAADIVSSTLRDFINTSSKDDLLHWLRTRDSNTKGDDFSNLQFLSVLGIRDYILSGRYTNCKSGKGKKRTDSNSEAEDNEPVRKITKKVRVGVSNVLLKPAGAARTSREVLQDWYEGKMAPELRAEVSRRRIKPVPSRKADLVAVLVDDDEPR